MSKKIKLKKPIMAHGEGVTEIELKEPTVKELRAIDPDIDKMATLVEMLANLNKSAVNGMSIPDFMNVSDQVAPFFPSPNTDKDSQ